MPLCAKVLIILCSATPRSTTVNDLNYRRYSSRCKSARTKGLASFGTSKLALLFEPFKGVHKIAHPLDLLPTKKGCAMELNHTRSDDDSRRDRSQSLNCLAEV